MEGDRSQMSEIFLRDFWRSDGDEYLWSVLPEPLSKRVSPVKRYFTLFISDFRFEARKHEEPGVWPGVWKTLKVVLPKTMRSPSDIK